MVPTAVVFFCVKQIGKLGAGMYFGEKALLSEDSRAATILTE